MNKSLTDIAKEQGAIVLDGIDFMQLDEAQLRATIDAYNAQMSEPVGVVTYQKHFEYDRDTDSKPFTAGNATIDWGKVKTGDKLYTAPTNKDLISRDDAIHATINAVNAQNDEVVNSSFQFWTEKERREISNEGQFGLFCSEDEACDIIQEVEALCFRKWKLSISPQVIPPKTLPPEWAEYIDRLENALAEIMHLTKHGYACMNVAKEALASKPKG